MIIKNIRIGLELLEQYAEKDVQVTEVGNCLAVWNYGTHEIVVPVDIKRQLNNYSEVDGWLHNLS